MKITLKRVTSALLCLLMMITLLAPVSAASTINDLPIIHVFGKLKPVYNKKGEQVYPLKKSVVDCIKDNSDSIISAASKGILWDNWSPLKNELSKALKPSFEDLVLDNNGEISNGSYTTAYYTPQKKTSNFQLNDYMFRYDWRLDSIELAKDLDGYIDRVLAATGKKKVQIVSRCLGTSIVASYLTIYGNEKVDTCVLYAGSAMGIIPASVFFSGHLEINPAALKRYASTIPDDSDLNSIIKLFSSMINNSAIVKSITTKNFKKGVDAILPDMLLQTYATMPGYWSMVSDEYYEEAKSFVFNGREDYYAGLIEKIDNYHYNVQSKFEETLINLKQEGLKINIFVKYNYEMAPIFENGTKQSDITVDVDAQSYGATSANFGETLPAAYIQQAKDFGFGDYISADGIIDASTCIFPDYTWFIKDAAHENWPDEVYNFIVNDILHSKDQYTIHTNKNRPQFMQYNDYTKKLDKLTAKYTVQSAALTQDSYAYTGEIIKPKAVIRNNAGKTLKEGTDYTLVYSSGCKNVGRYSVDIVYKGSYTGRTTLYFDILPGNCSALTGKASTNYVKLSWDNVYGADGYKIYKYDTASKSYKLLKTIKGASVLTYKAKNLTPATSYKFAVKAYKDSNGKTLLSSDYAVLTTATLPEAPEIKVTASSKSANITWNNISGATGYQVYMSNVENGSYKKVASTKDLSYIKTGLKNGQSYYFKVRAYTKLNGNYVYSSYSKPKMIEGTNKPAKPTIKLSSSTKSATVSWTAIPGAQKYVVYMATSKNGSYKKLGSTKSTSYTKTSLKAGTTYYFKVRAYTKADGKGYYSSYSSIKSIKATNTPAKSTLKASPKSAAVQLSWSAVTGSKGYEVYMATAKNGTYKKIKTTSALKFEKTGLKKGSTYYFKVRAYSVVSGKTYYGSYSAIKSAKVK